MAQGRIFSPSPSCVLEVSLLTTPAEPDEEAIAGDEKEGEDDEEDGTDFGDLDEITAEIVNDTRVEFGAESDGCDLWDWERSDYEIEFGKSVVDVFLD